MRQQVIDDIMFVAQVERVGVDSEGVERGWRFVGVGSISPSLASCASRIVMSRGIGCGW